MDPLTLRFPEPGDAPALHAAVRESLAELYAWMAWCGLDYSLDDAAQWIDGQPRARAAGTAFEFVIVDRQGCLLGCCGINQIHPAYRLANFGYWVRTAAAGRGVATRAATELADWAFAHTDLERLEILAAVDNLASQAVAVKIGARREGVLRSRLVVHGHPQDAVLLSILRAEWRRGAGAAVS